MKKCLIALCSVLGWLLASHSSCQAQGEPEDAPIHITPAVTRQLIDSIRQELYKNYIFPDTALKMANYLEEQYKKGAYAAIKDPRELARRLDMDLHKAHHDGHLRLMYAPSFARQLSDTAHAEDQERRNDSLQLITMRKSNFFFT